VTELKSSATFTWESSNEFIAQLEKMTDEVRECIRVLDQTAEDVTDLVAQRNALREVLEPVEVFLEQASDIYRTLDYAWVVATAKLLLPSVRAALAWEPTTTCPVCNGRGEIEDSGDPSTGYGPVNVECRRCEGRGTI
jgi:hypothetical protein